VLEIQGTGTYLQIFKIGKLKNIIITTYPDINCVLRSKLNKTRCFLIKQKISNSAAQFFLMAKDLAIFGKQQTKKFT
jgi:hypothetical protein